MGFLKVAGWELNEFQAAIPGAEEGTILYLECLQIFLRYILQNNANTYIYFHNLKFTRCFLMLSYGILLKDWI